MLIVGLTGGIGCGKSAAAEMFARLGATVIDTDQIARQLTASGQPALAAIRKQFGAGYFLPDGSLDRTRLRKLVFSNTGAKKQLEALLHPLIKDEVQSRLLTVQSPYAIIAVPLLLETGAYRERVQRILVVDCEEEQQVKRVMARSGLSEAEVRAIMACQVSRAERLRLADDIIDNRGERNALQQQVEQLHRHYLQLV
ncbi:MAG: dephospho-CoA kinase [Sulfurimicrobium sp.]